MKTVIFAIGMCVGVVVALLVRIDSCSKVIVKENIKYDTIRVQVTTIPEPKIYYRTSIDTLVKYYTWVEYRDLIDSIYLDTSRHEIPINRYTDHIDQDSVQLDYTIETLGFLTEFDPVFMVKRKIEYVPYKKNWLVGVGLSDKANWKGSIGYKGWMAEVEFAGGYKFNQIYIGKMFAF